MNRNSILRIEFTSIKVTQRLFESRVKLKQKKIGCSFQLQEFKSKKQKKMQNYA